MMEKGRREIANSNTPINISNKTNKLLFANKKMNVHTATQRERIVTSQKFLGKK